MELDATPRLTETEERALSRALGLAKLRLHDDPAAYASAWRRAATLEAVDAQPPVRSRYAPSPRSTRGASRA